MEKTSILEKIFMVFGVIIMLPILLIRVLVTVFLVPAFPALITGFITGAIGLAFADVVGMWTAIIGASIAYVIAFVINIIDLIHEYRGEDTSRGSSHGNYSSAKPVFGVNRVTRVQNIAHNLSRRY